MTIQNDDPGLYSAALFTQSAIGNISKRREHQEIKAILESMQHLPRITYQSNTTEVLNALRQLGSVSVDGVAKVSAIILFKFN